MKKNNTAQKTILEAKEISKALKKGTEKSIRNIITESISDYLNKYDDDDDTEDADDNLKDENEFTEKDVKIDDDTAEKDDDENVDNDNIEDAQDDTEDDEWSDFDAYKVGDDDYDFTSMDGDDILKVYNKLGDDDKIYVKKVDDNTFKVNDDETGAEYTIELDSDALDNNKCDDDNCNLKNDDDSFEINDDDDDDDSFEVVDDDDDDDDDDSFEVDDDDDSFEIVDDDDDDSFEIVDDDDDDDSIEVEINDDDDKLNEEGLDYTDSYQKDVFAKKFNMNEPANSKATYSMNAGVPKGNTKPWAGKGDMKPFDQKVNECDKMTENKDEEVIDEGAMTTSSQSVAKVTHTPTSGPRAEHARKVAKNLHANGEYVSKLEESVKKIVAQAKQIQTENKQYKKALSSIKKSLCEAAVSNVTLAQVVKLLSEETCSKKEKQSIVERFGNVKTLQEGKSLYDTVKRELNENKKAAVVLEKQISADSTKMLNEKTIYQNSNPSIDFMNRMDSIETYWKAR